MIINQNIFNTEEFRQSQADYLFIIRSNEHRKDKGEEKGPVKDDILHYVTLVYHTWSYRFFCFICLDFSTSFTE